MKINIKIICNENGCNGEMKRTKYISKIIMRENQVYIDTPLKCNKCGSEKTGKVLMWSYGAQEKAGDTQSACGMG